jgi:hypothetical protein
MFSCLYVSLFLYLHAPLVCILPRSCICCVSYVIMSVLSKLYYDRQSVGQSVLVSGTHLGPATNFFPLSLWVFFRQLRVCWCGAPSLTRSRVWTFQFLQGIASAAFLRSESHGTHEHSLLSLFLRLPQPGWPGSCIYFPKEQGMRVLWDCFYLYIFTGECVLLSGVKFVKYLELGIVCVYVCVAHMYVICWFYKYNIFPRYLNICLSCPYDSHISYRFICMPWTASVV